MTNKQSKAVVGVPLNWYKRIADEFKTANPTDDYKNYDEIRLPSIIRMCIVGASGAMKTNSLLTILLNMCCWTKIYLFCKAPDEPLYKFLTAVMNAVGKKFKMELIIVSTSLDTMPTVEQMDKKHRILLIIDDMAAEKDSKLEKVSEIYTWMRKLGCGVSAIYISQQFTKIPYFVRNNSDVILMKRINQNKDLNRILAQYSLDNSTNEIWDMYKTALEGLDESFFLMDLTKPEDDPLRFRKNFSPIT
jgi:hypothetical protein